MNTIDILLLEKNINHANSLILELISRDCHYNISHVTTVEAFIDEARGSKWDLIISEYSVYGWTALDSLKFLKDNEIKSPFIVVTETQSEEAAVECIKGGAVDYLVYPNIKKASKTISSALKNKSKKNSTEKLTKNEFFKSFELMYESIPMPIILFDEQTLEILYVNQFAEEYFRVSRDRIMNLELEECAEEKFENMVKFIPRLSQGMDKICNWRHYRKDGTVLEAEISSNTISLADGKVRVSVITDMSGRRRSFEPVSQRLN